MAIKTSTSKQEDIHAGGGNWLDAANGVGTHHMACMEAIESPTTEEGKAMDAEAKFVMQVVASTNPAAVGKQYNLIAWTPKLNEKDGGKLALRRKTAIYLALGVLQPSDLGKEGVVIEPTHGRGRQCFATLDTYTDSNGKAKLSIFFDSVFHVDDPAAKDFPRDAKALGLLPANLRRTADSFKKPDAATSGSTNGNGHANGGGSGGSKQPAASGVDLSDL